MSDQPPPPRSPLPKYSVNCPLPLKNHYLIFDRPLGRRRSYTLLCLSELIDCCLGSDSIRAVNNSSPKQFHSNWLAPNMNSVEEYRPISPTPLADFLIYSQLILSVLATVTSVWTCVSEEWCVCTGTLCKSPYFHPHLTANSVQKRHNYHGKWIVTPHTNQL